MKIEDIDLHGLNWEEAKQKLETNVKWCARHEVDVLDINHGKGRHSQHGIGIIKAELRKLLKSGELLSEYGYIMIRGESDLPIALTYDEGHTLLVKPGIENEYTGGRKQQEHNQQVYSAEAKAVRKTAKQMRKRK